MQYESSPILRKPVTLRYKCDFKFRWGCSGLIIQMQSYATSSLLVMWIILIVPPMLTTNPPQAKQILHANYEFFQ